MFEGSFCHRLLGYERMEQKLDSTYTLPMNTMPRLREAELIIGLYSAFLDGLTRKEACRECGMDRATFYRWMKRKPDFRQFIEDLEAESATLRDVRRWRLHPFRGKRPPRKDGSRGSVPKPRYRIRRC